jgi:hypothetical protein
MKLVKWSVLAAIMALGLACPVWAAIPSGAAGMGGASVANGASGVVERGGTITAINPDGRRVSVDGKNYILSYSVKVHDAAGRLTSRNNLRKRMLIRFNTNKNKYSGHEDVVEIWVVNPVGTSLQK